VRGLSELTGGLAGPRDPAAPLLTLYDGPGRVELSGATTANWVAKSANLLVDGLGAPSRVGLLLPLHWQTVALLLAVVATDATAVVGSVEGCEAAFVAVSRLDEAAGVDEVLALSGAPLGGPCGPLPALVQDYAREVPAYGDRFTGPRPAEPRVEPPTVPLTGLGPADRLLTTLGPEQPGGLAALLGALRAGAGLVLAVGAVDLPAVAAAERVTAVAGADDGALPRLL
jgi:uncharacterized protein (TIGR03089 family)